MPCYLRHQPSRGIGGETANRKVDRSVNLPSGGRFSGFTEDTRKHAAEASGARRIIYGMTRRASKAASQQALSEEEALPRRIEEKSKEFVEKGAEVYSLIKPNCHHIDP